MRACYLLLVTAVFGAVLVAGGRKLPTKSTSRPDGTQLVCPDFTCPAGETRVPNPDFTPTSEGCGVSAVRMSTKVSFDDCCVTHDKCYGTCGRSKADCDAEFSECMNKQCEVSGRKDLRRNCNTEAKMLTLGVSLGDCEQYNKGQADSCKCAPAPNHDEL